MTEKSRWQCPKTFRLVRNNPGLAAADDYMTRHSDQQFENAAAHQPFYRAAQHAFQLVIFGCAVKKIISPRASLSTARTMSSPEMYEAAPAFSGSRHAPPTKAKTSAEWSARMAHKAETNAARNKLPRKNPAVRTNSRKGRLDLEWLRGWRFRIGTANSSTSPSARIASQIQNPAPL